MRVKIVAVGRKSSAEIASLCGEYQKRLSATLTIEWKIIDNATGKMTRQEQRERESQSVYASLNQNDFVVLLDEVGRQLDNSQLADNLKNWQLVGKDIVFVIGGAFGVSEELKQRADFVWSVSNLVFPHQIVRLLLVEQLYRSQTIIDGHSYHHE